MEAGLSDVAQPNGWINSLLSAAMDPHLVNADQHIRERTPSHDDNILHTHPDGTKMRHFTEHMPGERND